MTARQTGFTVLMSVSGCWKNLEPVSIYFAMARVTANTKLRFYRGMYGPAITRKLDRARTGASLKATKVPRANCAARSKYRESIDDSDRFFLVSTADRPMTGK
jgi:hypothetical protein